MASHAPGYITGSTVSALLTGKKDKLLVGGVAFAMQIAMERCGLVEIPPDFQGNEATEWGNMYEEEAIQRYEEVNFSDVHGKQEGFCTGWTSCTPDGLIGGDGVLEIKCPFQTKNHLDYLLSDESFKAKYEDQAQFNMMLTGREWCDLVSYDPRWTQPLDIKVVHIEACEQWQERAMDRIQQTEAVIKDTLKRINQIARPEAA